MKCYTDFKQYSDSYWAIRRGLPTASEFHNIVTAATGELSMNRAGTDLSDGAKTYMARLIADRIDPRYFERCNDEQGNYVSAAMKNGTRLEPEARAWYELSTSSKISQVGFCTTEDGKIGGSPDGLVDHNGTLELKSPEPHTHIRWLLDGVVPAKHKAQCHGHMAVSEGERTFCDFLSYVPEFPEFRVRVQWDEYTDNVLAAVRRFTQFLDEAWQKVRAMLPQPEPTPINDEDEALSMFTIK